MNSSSTLGSAGRFLHLLNSAQHIWMGILNVTPDSFSDGGCYVNAEAALKRASSMIEAGALIVDVGGASTRPGAALVSSAEECARVLPLLQALRAQLAPQVLISLDTYSPETAFRAAQMGCVDIVNDVYAGRRLESVDGQSWTTCDVAAKFQLAWVGMHMLGTPTDMQQNPMYTDCVGEVVTFLKERIDVARAAGVQAIAIDPGIGFGKRVDDNVALLSERGLQALCALGAPVLIGLSRKRFLTDLFSELLNSEPSARDARSKEWEWRSLQYGARIIRTHLLPSELK